MNKCLKCGVNILDQTDVCPLCHCVVEMEGQEAAKERYPDIRLNGKKVELVSRIVLFLSIVIGVLAVIINYTQQPSVWWSFIVVGGLIYVQLIMFFFIENEHAGYRSKVFIGAAYEIAYVVLIDYIFGFTHWSLEFAVPSTLLVIDLMIAVVMFVNIRNWQSYLLFQILMILCSGFCAVLSLIGMIEKPLMSYLAFGISCTLFLATFIIGGKRASNELKRRFHVM